MVGPNGVLFASPAPGLLSSLAAALMLLNNIKARQKEV